MNVVGEIFSRLIRFLERIANKQEPQAAKESKSCANHINQAYSPVTRVPVRYSRFSDVY